MHIEKNMQPVQPGKPEAPFDEGRQHIRIQPGEGITLPPGSETTHPSPLGSITPIPDVTPLRTNFPPQVSAGPSHQTSEQGRESHSSTLNPVVLLVAQDPSHRTLFQRLLLQNGYQVWAAESGDEGLDLLARDLPHVVLIDDGGQSELGVRLIGDIRSRLELAALPVILLSPVSAPRAVASALNEGANDYVTRPVDAAVLRARIDVQLRTAHLLHEASSSAKALATLADIDELTGVFNRRHLMRILQSEMKRSERYRFPLSTMILDLDHFKQVNDTYGHDAGDRVLQHFTQLVRRCLRSVDVLCRFGGEEFCAVLITADLEQTVQSANRIREAVQNEPFVIRPDLTIHLTVSIGVTTWQPHHRSDPNKLLKEADQALYKAKQSGRNRALPYNPEEETMG